MTTWPDERREASRGSDEHLWNTLAYFYGHANEDDDLTVEAMAWAYLQIKEMAAVLRRIAEPSRNLETRMRRGHGPTWRSRASHTVNLDAELCRAFGPMVHDPPAWVAYSYKWRKPGTPLEHEPGPEKWQWDLLCYIRDQLKSGRKLIRIAVRSGHGVGKSALMAMVRGWGMSTLENTRGVVTANTGQQLVTKTLPEFAKWHNLAVNAHWFDGTMAYRYRRDEAFRESWRFDAVTWAAENPAAFAGLHNAGRRILLMFDEASEIPPVIWETAEGALTDLDTEIIWLVFGNPTQVSGRFTDCFGAGRHLWHTVEVDARQVRRTNKALIEEWIAYYGEDSDFIRVRVKGQAPRLSSNQFISQQLVDAAIAREVVAQVSDPLVWGLDIARFGDDATVLYRRRGYDGRGWPPLHWRGLDTMQVAARVAELARAEKPDAIFADIGAMGAGVVDRLMQLGVRGVMGVDFGADADRGSLFSAGAPHEAYFNKRAEMWGGTRAWLKAGGAIPGNVKELRDDLLGVQYGERNEKILLERKADMRKRGLASPDWGDALALTFAYPVLGSRLQDEAEKLRKRSQRYEDDPRMRLIAGVE